MQCCHTILQEAHSETVHFIRECPLAQCLWGGGEGSRQVRERHDADLTTSDKNTESLQLKWLIRIVLHGAKMDRTFNQSEVMYHIWPKSIALKEQRAQSSDSTVKDRIEVADRGWTITAHFDEILLSDVPLIKFPRQNLWSDRTFLYPWSSHPLPQTASQMLEYKPWSHSTITVKQLITNVKVLCLKHSHSFILKIARAFLKWLDILQESPTVCCCSPVQPAELSLVGRWCQVPAIQRRRGFACWAWGRIRKEEGEKDREVCLDLL